MNTLKRLLPLTLCLFTVGAAHADLIKTGAAYNRTVLITSSTDHISGATGLTAFTVTLSKAGGAVATITPTVTEIGAGRYSVALVTGNTGTLGALDMTITATGADPTDSHDQIVAFDPADSSLLGLTGVGTLANQSTIITSVAGIPAAVWIYTASDGLTHQQSDALRTSILARGFLVTYNASTRAQVTTYYKADGATVLATTTVVYDLTGRAVSRITAFTNLP